MDVRALLCLLALVIGPSDQNQEHHTRIIKAEAKFEVKKGNELKLSGRVPVKECNWIFQQSKGNVRCCYPEDRCSQSEKDMHSPDCKGNLDVKYDEQKICTLLIPDIQKTDEGTYIMQSADIFAEAEDVIMKGEDLTLTARGAEGGSECQWIQQNRLLNKTCCFEAANWRKFNPACNGITNNRECRGEDSNSDSEMKYPKVKTTNTTCSLVIENADGVDVGSWLGFLPHDSKITQANYTVTFKMSHHVNVVFDECLDCPECSAFYEYAFWIAITVLPLCCLLLWLVYFFRTQLLSFCSHVAWSRNNCCSHKQVPQESSNGP